MRLLVGRAYVRNESDWPCAYHASYSTYWRPDERLHVPTQRGIPLSAEKRTEDDRFSPGGIFCILPCPTLAGIDACSALVRLAVSEI